MSHLVAKMLSLRIKRRHLGCFLAMGQVGFHTLHRAVSGDSLFFLYD
jgi:hypothetical protein